MIREFKYLPPSEIEFMYSVPAMVAILISGADDEINQVEMREAINLAKLKQTKAREELIGYYRDIGHDFEDRVKRLLERYPSDAKERNSMIIAELEKVNHILPKLDHKFAVEFYESMKDMARKIAESSGGVIGYLTVGYAESKLIGLDMINDPS